MADETAYLSRARTWNAFFGEARVSEFRRRLYLEAFGDEYPEEAATDGYITRSELRQLADALRVGAGRKIADLGCGRGGPGQWIAQTTGATLVGIDFSDVGLRQALERALRNSLEGRVAYTNARFDSTGLNTASLDGAISIDVIWAIPDKAAGFREAARILKPGARFAFVDWQRDLSPPGYPPPVNDHRPLLESAGFAVELHQFAPHFDAMRRKFYELMLERQSELSGDPNDKTAQSNLREARAWLGHLDGIDYMKHSRRVLVVARRIHAPRP